MLKLWVFSSAWPPPPADSSLSLYTLPCLCGNGNFFLQGRRVRILAPSDSRFFNDFPYLAATLRNTQLACVPSSFSSTFSFWCLYFLKTIAFLFFLRVGVSFSLFRISFYFILRFTPSFSIAAGISLTSFLPGGNHLAFLCAYLLFAQLVLRSPCDGFKFPLRLLCQRSTVSRTSKKSPASLCRRRYDGVNFGLLALEFHLCVSPRSPCHVGIWGLAGVKLELLLP